MASRSRSSRRKTLSARDLQSFLDGDADGLAPSGKAEVAPESPLNDRTNARVAAPVSPKLVSPPPGEHIRKKKKKTTGKAKRRRSIVVPSAGELADLARNAAEPVEQLNGAAPADHAAAQTEPGTPVKLGTPVKPGTPMPTTTPVGAATPDKARTSTKPPTPSRIVPPSRRTPPRKPLTPRKPATPQGWSPRRVVVSPAASLRSLIRRFHAIPADDGMARRRLAAVVFQRSGYPLLGHAELDSGVLAASAGGHLEARAPAFGRKAIVTKLHACARGMKAAKDEERLATEAATRVRSDRDAADDFQYWDINTKRRIPVAIWQARYYEHIKRDMAKQNICIRLGIRPAPSTRQATPAPIIPPSPSPLLESESLGPAGHVSTSAPADQASKLVEIPLVLVPLDHEGDALDAGGDEVVPETSTDRSAANAHPVELEDDSYDMHLGALAEAVNDLVDHDADEEATATGLPSTTAAAPPLVQDTPVRVAPFSLEGEDGDEGSEVDGPDSHADPEREDPARTRCKDHRSLEGVPMRPPPVHATPPAWTLPVQDDPVVEDDEMEMSLSAEDISLDLASSNVPSTPMPGCLEEPAPETPSRYHDAAPAIGWEVEQLPPRFHRRSLLAAKAVLREARIAQSGSCTSYTVARGAGTSAMPELAAYADRAQRIDVAMFVALERLRHEYHRKQLHSELQIVWELTSAPAAPAASILTPVDGAEALG